MKHLRYFFLTLTLLILCKAISAQPKTEGQADSERLDHFLQLAHSFNQFNGSVAITQKGKLILSKGYGFRDVAKKLYNDNQTIYRIGSITKPFTSTLILLLEQKGKLSIQDKIDKYFPDMPWANTITIEQLLKHSSGLRDYSTDLDRADSAIICHPVAKQQVLKHFIGSPLEFPPGSKYHYSNSGYYLLGMIIEKITGKPYEQNIRELIFFPLAMDSSGFDFNGNTNERKAVGYQFLTAEMAKPDIKWDSTITYAAGGIYSTPNDMVRWAKAVSQKQILTPATWNIAHTAGMHDYGLGWETGKLGNHFYIGHNGGLPGFSAQLLIFPEDDIQIVLLSNVHEKTLVTPISKTLGSILLHESNSDIPNLRSNLRWELDMQRMLIGTYQLDKAHKLEISIKGNELYIQSATNKLPLTRLVPQDEKTAVFADVFSTLQIKLEKSSPDQIKHLLIIQNGQQYKWKKL